MAELKDWCVKTFNEDSNKYYLTGFVYDHDRLCDGKYVYTTAIKEVQCMGDYVIATTKNTDYILKKENIDAAFSIVDFDDLCKGRGN